MALTKPRIIELLLVTTVPTMVVAERGLPSLWLMVATVLGGTLRRRRRQRHQHVRRPRHRPPDEAHPATGRSSPASCRPRAALIFADRARGRRLRRGCGRFVNLLSAVLAVAACLFYVFVYTLWLKRTSTSNIVIGGAAGAVPVLIGWSAVTNSLGWAPVVLFAVIFLWTPPHFWALAIRYRDDYAAADVPMLPVVASLRTVGIRILLYTLVLWALTLVFSPVAGMGALYLAVAIVLGAVFTVVRRRRDPQPEPGAGHAAVRLLDHLPHAAVRGDGRRRTAAQWAVRCRC